ncbi:hypothetical protein [Halopelagius longus]|uniref:Uncharacterized protein n=1 Tax=Halopelagius longus TaxID=1236180 RepID=A0A1H1ED95_9EURY|nr:hypothetical protein [Halopelagius longus]RDI71710.1 hypothetical protein DWB78_08210 [Halopelagius longus]SDQ86771.1 hypothetical protein SAMN05216278_2853 [Halopelagius longus]
MPGPSRWWYGVAPFPVVVCTAFLAEVAARRFVAVSTAAGDPNVALGLASFALVALAQGVSVLVAVVVLASLLLDVRALRRAGEWTPTWAWGLAGVVHFAAVEFTPLFLVSVPSLAYYLYRRRERAKPR